MLGTHRRIVFSQPCRPRRPQVTASPRRLPPNLTEKLSQYSKSEGRQGTPSKLCKLLTFERHADSFSKAYDEARGSSVNTMRLGMRWHLIE